ncbi:hypothetical protein [Aggregatibacter actinomycetemcomitans]|uniref:hypothetical protein n=1 Tax=Aggregatibacter actinomycetemcomitans TaxID=714 RepID=UPI0011DAE69F|nr:hypothetical protein [Aggregatibacter actinomycetemcomitans]TYB21058.1 hypothetical protein FXB85_01820 [Aggregatibacter actinomycetemcomitans]
MTEFLHCYLLWASLAFFKRIYRKISARGKIGMLSARKVGTLSTFINNKQEPQVYRFAALRLIALIIHPFKVLKKQTVNQK